jgi:flagellar motor protein MotB
MQRVIVGSSFVFTIAAIFIFSLALRAPVSSDVSSITGDPDTTAPTVSVPIKEIVARMEQEQNANRALITELQNTISKLKEDFQRKQESSPTAATQDPPGQENSILILGGGLFQSGRIEPSASLRDAIEKTLPIINAKPTAAVVVEGHTDSMSLIPDTARAFSENMKLSLLRANSVALVLEEKGIASDRIIVRAYGDTRPLAPNNTPEGRAQNRRVEIKLLSPRKQ